mgnify:CR=1 FL=1
MSNIRIAKKYNGFYVDDTKEALINIGKFARNRFNGITIGITGSSGKLVRIIYYQVHLINMVKLTKRLEIIII